MKKGEAQRRARNRQEQQRIQQRWLSIQNSNRGIDPIFAKLGLFNVLKESDRACNVIRCDRRKHPVEFGNHWLHWRSPQGHLYLAYQIEHFERNRYGEIIRVEYESDNIDLTPHAIQRLWERSGVGIGEYSTNLGLGDIAPYLSHFNLIIDSPLIEANELAVRTDIPLPFRGGLFLGNVGAGPGSWFFTRDGRYNLGSNIVKYCAQTWVAANQLKPEQKLIHDLLVQGRWAEAAREVEKTVWLIEAFDPEESGRDYLEHLSRELDKIDKSVLLI